MIRPCVITITCKGRKHVGVNPLFRPTGWVTVMETVCVDKETGDVLNFVTSHMSERDTITLDTFWDDKR